MTEIKIYGASASPFVRTVRMTAHEKGVSYDLVQHAPWDTHPDSPHPFRRIPTMRHGDFTLYESQAIAQYLDNVFDGQKLVPAEPRAAAMVDQWVSVICDYFAKSMVGGLIGPRVIFPRIGRPVDEQAVANGLPKLREHLDLVEAALAKGGHLAGAQLTLADLYLAPILFYVGITPEGPGLLAGRKAIANWRERVFARPSFAATMPEWPSNQAAA